MKQKESTILLESFTVEIDENGIALFQPRIDIEQNGIDSLDKLKLFSESLLCLSKQENVQAILYVVPQVDAAQMYGSIIKTCYLEQDFNLFRTVYHNIGELLSIEKPLVALITTSCQNLSLSSALWARYRFVLEDSVMSFEDSKYGLFAGFGINSILSTIGNPELSLSFLLKQMKCTVSNGLEMGLIDGKGEILSELVDAAKSYLLNPLSRLEEKDIVEISESQLTGLKTYVNKYTGRLPEGLEFAFENIHFSCSNDVYKSLEHEKELYLKLWADPSTLAYLRTQYYGIKDAVRNAQAISVPNFELKRLGILGAGMMGAGIAFEAAKAGVEVVLKDSTVEKARIGKDYSVQVTNKLIQQKRMTSSQQELLLSHIYPTADLLDFEELDLIIEAVNEDKGLKAVVSSESFNRLNNTGFFASNTTSIPISELASAINDSSRFIGMHFFSPVDRMPLVEIIKGENTSEETLQKSIYVAAKLGKIPIVVNDGPAFFTSRIFFNYLLEAITMLLEGIDPAEIEKQAKVAGFGASPLAVLDEISLPLMLQVYSQLPEMHASQQRAFTFLTTMVESERLGRKAGAGFYSYTTEGKELWCNPAINIKHQVDPIHIQKRLLNVVALDSYRCLESGILMNPIDADLGSILGLGYPARTGGVMSYIDLVGLEAFVTDCKSFEAFGEQWTLTDKLQDLAKQNFSFYTGLESNW